MIRGDARRAVPAIVFLAALLGAATSLGHARALSSGETARLLARVEANDGKCRFLDAADHDALKILAARAEVAAAGEGGPVEANAAVAAGRAEAAAAACDEASARLVRSAYGSAESAASGRPRRRAATRPERPIPSSISVAPPSGTRAVPLLYIVTCDMAPPSGQNPVSTRLSVPFHVEMSKR